MEKTDRFVLVYGRMHVHDTVHEPYLRVRNNPGNFFVLVVKTEASSRPEMPHWQIVMSLVPIAFVVICYDGRVMDSAVHGLDMSGSNFEGANLKNAIMNRTNLSNANFRLASLDNSSLKDCKLTGADLSGATLINADIRGANFEGAILVDTILIGAVCDVNTIWPTGSDRATRRKYLQPGQKESSWLSCPCPTHLPSTIKMRLPKKVPDAGFDRINNVCLRLSEQAVVRRCTICTSADDLQL
jgi:hypothetical protein